MVEDTDYPAPFCGGKIELFVADGTYSRLIFEVSIVLLLCVVTCLSRRMP